MTMTIRFSLKTMKASINTNQSKDFEDFLAVDLEINIAEFQFSMKCNAMLAKDNFNQDWIFRTYVIKAFNDNICTALITIMSVYVRLL